MRVLEVQVVAGHLDQARFFEEALVDGAQFVGRGVERLLDVEQQNLAELRNRLGRPVVPTHHGLAGAHGQA
ncbi:hypothetical protein D3C72_2254810 [compost metagenome]